MRKHDVMFYKHEVMFCKHDIVFVNYWRGLSWYLLEALYHSLRQHSATLASPGTVALFNNRWVLSQCASWETGRSGPSLRASRPASSLVSSGPSQVGAFAPPTTIYDSLAGKATDREAVAAMVVILQGEVRRIEA